MARNGPTRLVARNVDTGEVVATRVTVATRMVERGIGLLNRHRFEPGEALLITPCRGVHTWGMRFAIDVVALDASGIVVDAVSSLGPWRIRLPRRGGDRVLELPEGSLVRTGTQRGHRIVLDLVKAWEMTPKGLQAA
ncbi:MAG TPA: DUF192 domain-containing protein [Vicinamibacterales bacterium]|jgi:hypothetical protein|nr:DUF192 domain-containing protein [Vicinamibacterales bacterium]